MLVKGDIGQADGQVALARGEGCRPITDGDAAALTLFDGLPHGQGLDGTEADEGESKGRSDHVCGRGCGGSGMMSIKASRWRRACSVDIPAVRHGLLEAVKRYGGIAVVPWRKYL